MGNIFKILTYKQVEAKCSQLPRRFTIEINNNEVEKWVVHIHYRNLRLEMSVDEFREFASGVEGSIQNLNNLKRGIDEKGIAD